MYMFIIVPWVYVILFCFKQLPLNSILFSVPDYLGQSILLNVVGDLIISLENPLDYNDKI